MTVPDGAPKHIEWADRMSQALQVVGSDVTTLRMTYDPDGKANGIFDRIQKGLVELDTIRDEIVNSGEAETERSSDRS